MKNRKKALKTIIGMFVALLMTVLSMAAVNAAPISGIEQVVEQPNGDEITVYFYGDEIYSYMCDSDGNVVVQNDAGYYVYAALYDGNIVPTEYVCGDSGQGGAGGGGAAPILNMEDIPQSVIDNAYQNSRFPSEENISLYSMNYEDKNLNGVDINNIVVFIQFKDTSYTETRKSFYEQLFNTNADSVKQYYDEISYGKIGVTSTFYPNATSSAILTYRDINNASYYKASDYGYSWEKQGEREQAMFKRALEYVKDQIPADLDLDKDNDGYIDMITFVLPGRIVSGSNQVCWPHQWSFWSDNSITINGAKTGDYNVQIEGALRRITAADGTYTFQQASAIICHETLHILGFPDMYYSKFRYPTNKESLGKWDIMCESDGAHPSAYMKNVYGGWLDIDEIKTEGTYTMKPLDESGTCAYKIRSPYSANEYFVVEYRKKAGNFEQNIPDTGLVVYRVLADHKYIGNNNAASSNGTDDELRLLGSKAAGSYSPTLSNGSASGITISSISASGNTASFTVSFVNKMHLKYFRDKNLADAICTAIGKSEGDITDSDLQALASLSVSGYGKQSFDLSGIEHLTGLKTLSLINCEIDDISYLKDLTKLTSLNLNNNAISDISALSSLTGLKTLRLRGNYIDDYSPVASYYAKLTTKDFSLEDKNDAVFFVPNVSNGIIGDCVLKYSNTKPSCVYYIAEMRDKNTDEILTKQRGKVDTYYSGSGSKILQIPEKIKDSNDTYVVLRTYENDTYRHVMSETKIDGSEFDLSVFNN